MTRLLKNMPSTAMIRLLMYATPYKTIEYYRMFYVAPAKSIQLGGGNSRKTRCLLYCILLLFAYTIFITLLLKFSYSASSFYRFIHVDWVHFVLQSDRLYVVYVLIVANSAQFYYAFYLKADLVLVRLLNSRWGRYGTTYSASVKLLKSNLVGN